jgi:cysteine sulfinate desulfinase/cysteine desulfurase-like protein
MNSMTEEYGNPSSLHTLGHNAQKILKESRNTVAEFAGVRPAGVIFTSGGTEANNLAFAFLMRDPARIREKRVIISAVEHPAVSAPAQRLAALGAEVVKLPCLGRDSDSPGMIDLDALGEERADIISVMTVNNEIGTIQPIRELCRAVRSRETGDGRRAIIHSDAVQAFGKLPFPVAEGGADTPDMVSVSAHKIHGPKGIGALCCANPEKLFPLIFGGGQENGRRSGTENVPGAAGFAAAVMEAVSGDAGSGQMERIPQGNLLKNGGISKHNATAGWNEREVEGGRTIPENLDKTEKCSKPNAQEGRGGQTCMENYYINSSRIAALRVRLRDGIIAAIPDARINSPFEAGVNGEAGMCSPYILSVSFAGTRGEVLLHDLEQHGVYVSTGSACSSIGKKGGSRNAVLRAVGLTDAEADATLRFSFSRYNTEAEIDYALERLTEAVRRFRKLGSYR